MKLKQYLTEQKGKPLTFVRFGGLSKVNQKMFYKDDTFHAPPAKKGIYAFIWPYIDNFLWGWKIPDVPDETEEQWRKRKKAYIKKHRKKFKYRGMIWTHFVDATIEGRRKGSWVEIHTDELEKLLKKVKHIDAKRLMSFRPGDIVTDPYKKGQGGYMSRDHLEVFIEKVN
jgi:hypothetical protein